MPLPDCAADSAAHPEAPRLPPSMPDAAASSCAQTSTTLSTHPTSLVFWQTRGSSGSTHSDDPARPRSTAPHKPQMGTTAAPHHGTDFHAHNPPPPPLFDGLSEPHARGRNQGWASPLPGPLRVPIDPHDLRAIDTSPIADPGNSAISRHSPTGQLNRQGSRFVLRGAKRPGHHEAGGAVPGQTSPPRAHPARRACWLSRVWALFLQMTRKHPPPPR